MPIFSPYFKARFHALMLTLSTAHTPSFTGGGVSGIKNVGVQFGLAFVFRGGNNPFLRASVHVACMIVNVILKIDYFWTLEKK